jgi:aryl-alcohol dehydrogenase-like predicted oxidoreductase
LIERARFGNTGHVSSRVIFGAAALGGMRQERADRVLETLLEFGINHIDTAASYGDSELRLAPWLREHRERFFLATKTGERTGAGARASLLRSLERLGVDSVDLIQFHNLVDEEGWDAAFAPNGAVEAMLRARDEGLVKFIGVTGHGTRTAEMHLRSLERFAFDSVLLPYNYPQMVEPRYSAEFEELVRVCGERGVAVQTIKSVARRRWQEMPERRFSWYEPLRDPDAVRRAVHFVLSRDGLFLNSSSDATLLKALLEAASRTAEAPNPVVLDADIARFEVEPLFVRGVAEGL